MSLAKVFLSEPRLSTTGTPLRSDIRPCFDRGYGQLLRPLLPPIFPAYRSQPWLINLALDSKLQFGFP
jgi:hypothetical protein